MLSADNANDLLDEIKQVSIKPCNNSSIGKIKNEIEYVETKINELKNEAENGEVSEELSINFVLLRAFHRRNLRIYNAYLFSRLKKIQNNYFDKNDIKDFLSVEEREFEIKFNNIFKEFLDNFSYLDFHNTDPPINCYVQILTLEDCGIILHGNDFIDLKKGKLYFLKKNDVAHLVSSGLAKIV